MKITFKIKQAKTNFGQSLYLIGNKDYIGDWKVSKYTFNIQIWTLD